MGYAAVSMSDIAEATNVGASALYRHFPSKAELLVAAVQAGLAPYGEVLDEADAFDDPAERLAHALRRLSQVTLEHRPLGVLWQREARNLPAAEQRVLRKELTSLTRRLSADILATRPDLDAGDADLLAWCAMGALVSPSFHSATLPRTQFAALLLDLVTTVVTLPMPAGEQTASAPSPETADETRRDTIITVATRLFADRGFAATGIDEIGDAAGIAGPSVYSHFDSKAAILVAAIQRAHAILRADADPVLRGDDPAPRKLAKLVDSYVAVANRDRAVIRTLLSELTQLPAADREVARQLQRDYIDAWVDLFRQFSASESVPARIRVQAVLLVVNDAVQTPHLRARPGFEQTLARMAKTLLGIESA
jgi:AcrR family transcriptional regulator